MFKILILEKTMEMQKNALALMKRSGYECIIAESSDKALEALDNNFTDIIIINSSAVDFDENSFVRVLRDNNNYIPIITVSKSNALADKLEALRAGVDEYLVEPVNTEELMLRIASMLRRSKGTSEKRIKIGTTELDYSSLTLTTDGKRQTLPKKEFYLLFKLLSHPGQIFTRLQLMDEIWGMESNSVDTTVNVHVNRLRKRLGDCNDFSIVAVKGVGYKAEIKK